MDNKKGEQDGRNDDGSGHHLIIGVPTSAHGSNLNPIAVHCTDISRLFLFSFRVRAVHSPWSIKTYTISWSLFFFFFLNIFLLGWKMLRCFHEHNSSSSLRPSVSESSSFFSLSRLWFHSLNSSLERTGGRESDNTISKLQRSSASFILLCSNSSPPPFFDNFKSHIDWRLLLLLN